MCINIIKGENTMSIPYTYYLINTITGEKYYGVRYANNCNPSELWVTYFSSSKYVKALIELYGLDSFKHEIRKTFNSPKEARDWEEKVLRRLNVLNSDIWLNRNICGKYLKEGPQSKEHKEKRLAKYKEYLKLHPRKLSEETKKKISKSSKGKSKPFSEKHIQSLKCHVNNQSVVNCPHCGKSGQLTNMKRWHFDRCKSNENRKTDLDAGVITCSKCGFISRKSPNFYKHHENNCNHVHNV